MKSFYHFYLNIFVRKSAIKCVIFWHTLFKTLFYFLCGKFFLLCGKLTMLIIFADDLIFFFAAGFFCSCIVSFRFFSCFSCDENIDECTSGSSWINPFVLSMVRLCLSANSYWLKKYDDAWRHAFPSLCCCFHFISFTLFRKRFHLSPSVFLYLILLCKSSSNSPHVDWTLWCYLFVRRSIRISKINFVLYYALMCVCGILLFAHIHTAYQTATTAPIIR